LRTGTLSRKYANGKRIEESAKTPKAKSVGCVSHATANAFILKVSPTASPTSATVEFSFSLDSPRQGASGDPKIIIFKMFFRSRLSSEAGMQREKTQPTMEGGKIES